MIIYSQMLEVLRKGKGDGVKSPKNFLCNRLHKISPYDILPIR